MGTMESPRCIGAKEEKALAASRQKTKGMKERGERQRGRQRSSHARHPTALNRPTAPAPELLTPCARQTVTNLLPNHRLPTDCPSPALRLPQNPRPPTRAPRTEIISPRGGGLNSRKIFKAQHTAHARAHLRVQRRTRAREHLLRAGSGQT